MEANRLVGRLPWARTTRLQQLHQLLSLLCVFIWGVCFSLKANPNDMKRSDTDTLLARGTRLLKRVRSVAISTRK